MQRWLWLSLAVILLDQTTKQLAEAQLSAYQAFRVLPFFDLTLMYNKGAAFSFLSAQGGWQRWFFVVLALSVCAVLVVWLRRLRKEEKWVALSLALIIGGAVGNVIDRILFGKVIDFIDLYYLAADCLPGFARLGNECHWPAFNVADSAISIGVAVMLLDAFVLTPRRGKLDATP
jgi:signal peptidase II